jgi:glycosyltransferase involved in cell wall biosynthesis
LGGLYTILLAKLPEAKVYHTLCTGFGGLFLAKAYAETGKPCITTEHGIYTNERRIEISLAEWLDDMKAMNLSVDVNIFERDLKDYWSDMFSGYSKLCYNASTKIITLFEGNRTLQIADGADPEKIEIIPNGIDYASYSKCSRKSKGKPSIALIGRVVPIKDVKTYIRAIGYLSKSISGLEAYIIGSTDDDPVYYEECLDLIEKSSLQNVITFTGKVDVKEFYPKIDVIVLSSLSEGQPLVILEAGAAGIPCVATNVGACREMIEGRAEEFLGDKKRDGGVIVPLANPLEISKAAYRLLTDEEYYAECSKNIQERVKTHYEEKDQEKAYKNIYDTLILESMSKLQQVGTS